MRKYKSGDLVFKLGTYKPRIIYEVIRPYVNLDAGERFYVTKMRCSKSYKYIKNPHEEHIIVPDRLVTKEDIEERIDELNKIVSGLKRLQEVISANE